MQSSLLAPPLDKLDTLYCSFYGAIVIQCLNEGLIPESIKNQDDILLSDDVKHDMIDDDTIY